MEQIDRQDWQRFKSEVSTKLSQENYKLLCKLHSKYYNHTYYEPCSCRPKTLKQWITQIDKIYNND